MKPKFRNLSFAATALLSVSSASAADAIWNVDTDGSWVTDANWNPASAPGATTGTTNPDTATFGNVISAGRIITVDTDRNIFGIDFNANSFAYTLSGGNILLSSGGLIQTSGAGTAHTDSIATAIAIQGENGTASITGGSSTTNRILEISGGITGVSTGTNVTTLTLNGANTGANIISGIIGNGSGGGALALAKSGAGTWNLSGANTYSGGTTLNGGTVVISNATAFGAGAISVTGNSRINAAALT